MCSVSCSIGFEKLFCSSGFMSSPMIPITEGVWFVCNNQETFVSVVSETSLQVQQLNKTL